MAAAKLLGLIPPVEVENVDWYLDGGTLGINLSAAGKPTLEVCLDNRVFQPSPRSIYVGARHPSSKRARRLQIGSPEDCAVVLLLRTWLERNFSPQELKEFHDIRAWRRHSAQQSNAAKILTWLDQREARQALYLDEDACARTFGLRAPVTLVRVVASDSSANTVGFVFRGALGGELQACFHRADPESPEGIWVGITAQARDSLVHSLASDSDEETAILGLLNHWFERNPPGASRKPSAGGVEPVLSSLLFRWMRMYPLPDSPKDGQLPTKR